MRLLTATGLRKEINAAPLLTGVSFALNSRDRLALAGPNGAGKTTLLRMLAGASELSGGELVVAKGVRTALHDQRPPAASDETLEDYVLSAAAELIELEQRLQALERRMAAGDAGDRTLRQYSSLQEDLERRGGYGWRAKVTATVRGLGFAGDELQRSLSTFSGGELTRASLARALATGAEILLLDEPTNHLDVESLEWLERWLRNVDAGVVLVAHDRWFLEATTTAVLELSGGHATYFPGAWHVWRREQAARESAAVKAAQRQADQLDRLERFVARFRYGTRARQAQSRLKQIDRIRAEPARGVRRPGPGLAFDFPAPDRTGRVVLEASSLSIEIGQRRLLSDSSLVVERGEHVALVGPNGSGKSTLLETLVGNRRPAAGEVRTGYGVQVGYFTQQDVQLDDRHTVLDAVVGATRLDKNQAQALLGLFLFSGADSHQKPVAALSGGERRRLGLACVVASGANLLILDEPTNHLDLEGRIGLEAALERFPGSVLLVSHDRALLDAVAQRVVAIEAGGLRSYLGGWAEIARRRAEAEAQAAVAPRLKQSRRGAPEKAPDASRALHELEDEIAACEERLADLERRLAAEWQDQRLRRRFTQATEELEALMVRWEALADV